MHSNPENRGLGAARLGLGLLLFIIVYTLLAAASVFADRLETVIAPPKTPPTAGESAEMTVYIHNTGEDTASIHLPTQVTCRILSADRTVEVMANAIEPFDKEPVALGQNSFLKVRYGFVVPSGFEGPVQFQILEFESEPVMFAVAAAVEPKIQVAAANEPEPEPYTTLDSLSTLYQPYLVNLAAYEPMYFLVGTNPEKSKFQLSFKYRFFDPEWKVTDNYPWFKGLHLGYTQTSYWDLESDSAPFSDTSYKPEVFYLSPNIRTRPTWMKGLFLQTGIQHESNGRGDDSSRSTNFLYAKPYFIFYDEDTQLGLQVAPKVWAYVHNEDENNPDLDDYRGYFDLEVKLGKMDGLVLGSHFWWADEGASTQLDLTYPFHHFFFKNLDFYLQAQYVNALAESLVDYTDRTEAVRLGFAIVR
jgi:phospholipase A1